MYQDLRLLLPAFLGETASVRQHNAAFAASVHVCGDDASVLSRERNVLLGKGGHRQNEGREERLEDQHQALQCNCQLLLAGPGLSERTTAVDPCSRRA